MNPNGKRKKAGGGNFLGFILFLLIGACCGFLMIKPMENALDMGNFPLAILFFAAALLWMYAAFFIQIVFHEAGHLIFGLLSGYAFSSFRIGSFMWLKSPSGLSFKRLSLAGTGGQCLMAPPEGGWEKMPCLLYNLGGSITNLLSAGLFFSLYLFWRPSPLPASMLLIIAFVGLAFALINGVPLRMGPVDNDGRNALSLRRSPAARRAFWVQLRINQLSARGLRLRDMPGELFSLPAERDMGNSLCASTAVFAANRLMDEMKLQDAERLMVFLLSRPGNIPGLYLGLIKCDLMYCELMGQNRPEALEALNTKEQRKFMASMKSHPSVIRSRYALALLSQRDMAEAEKLGQQFEKTARSYPYPAELEGERALMAAAREQAEKAAATAG